MARSIAEIKKTITDEFMSSAEVQIKYGLPAGAKWEDTFSKVSVENIIFYVAATAMFAVEKILDAHMTEVTEILASRLPHTSRWYRDKTLAYMYNYPLPDNSDTYDTADLPASVIEAAKVVKYAAVTEDTATSKINIKVAGDGPDGRAPISDDAKAKLENYLAKIKDAGIKIDIINREPDTLKISVNIVYDALLDVAAVKENCRTAAISYIENLPFNGEYTNSGMVDALQVITGIKDVYISSASVTIDGADKSITARAVPEAGYYRLGDMIITEEGR